MATPCGGLRVEPSVLQRLSADAAHLLIAAALQAVHLRHWAAPSKVRACQWSFCITSECGDAPADASREHPAIFCCARAREQARPACRSKSAHVTASSQDVRRVLITAASQQPAKYTVHKCIIERRADGHLHISPQP